MEGDEFELGSPVEDIMSIFGLYYTKHNIFKSLFVLGLVVDKFPRNCTLHAVNILSMSTSIFWEIAIINLF